MWIISQLAEKYGYANTSKFSVAYKLLLLQSGQASMYFNYLDFSTSVLVKFQSQYLSDNTAITIMNTHPTQHRLKTTAYQKVVRLTWGTELHDACTIHCQNTGPKKLYKSLVPVYGMNRVFFIIMIIYLITL
jgi:hypothetical protein